MTPVPTISDQELEQIRQGGAIGHLIGSVLGIVLPAIVLTAIVYGLLRLIGYRLKRSEQIIAFCACLALVAFAIISQRMHH
jgi:sorbitol-specific phosphotransferase system component IIC